ncbi:N-acetylmuramoyl-L-alanine amidase [Thermoflavimicrobium daqui]|jgi:N-acetylmuramoyl-L-alanine amidase|uniref:N-acetylmuramoyl-L-alanine amidase n=2 Tax=Thermoflavimicrobium daqui TaxID=2137476 RepID=A0A364K435_9BACL|nr:N-acetylmuramoyl-L-alanine amidase [Thermoflavimicrobium daqui]
MGMAQASNYLVALDDGHGLTDAQGNFSPTPGKRTPNIPGVGVIYENEFNRKVVQYLDEALKRCGFKTILTAPGDYDHSLASRCKRANDANADIFISCHYNHSGQSHPGNPGAQGVETYYYPETRSKRLAESVHKYVRTGTDQVDRGVKEWGELYVLRNTRMPACLIEFGFMDDEKWNYREAKLMKNEAFQRESAEQTAMGVCDYFGVKYIPPNNEPPKVYTYQILKKEGSNYKEVVWTAYRSIQMQTIEKLLDAGEGEILIKKVK